MAKRLQISEIVDRQISRTSASVADVKRGVERVVDSPMEKAADNLDKAATNYQAAITSGKTAARLRAVSLGDWKKATVAKADRISSGIAAAKGKLVDFHTKRDAHQQRINAELADMPTKTKEDMRSRMNTQFDGMSSFTFIPG